MGVFSVNLTIYTSWRHTMKSSIAIGTPLGNITITEDGGYITKVSFDDEAPSCDSLEQAHPVLRNAARQLLEYCDGKLTGFDLPLHPEGSDFQKNVWEALRLIPYGETASYKEIASSIGQPDASRAVGAANNKNPILIIIPCHRVIGADGSLVGYAAGLQVKEKLLALEKATRPA
jgi:methylated-DNA-[protein]-cysteine S-methyltransferase